MNYGQSADWNGTVGTGNVTTVGTAGVASTSHYGTYDQSGNVTEFNENNAAAGQAYRTLRGGSYSPTTPHWVSANERTWTQTNSENGTLGFRLGSVLNPPTPNPANSGDYNHNGVVDAADYVIWRKTLNQIGTALPADGDGNGSIGSGDYSHWRVRFGQPAGSATISSSAVPEPALHALLFIGVSAMYRQVRSKGA